MAKSREELFAAAKAKRKEEAEKKDNRGSYSYEAVAYTALSPDYDKVIRIMGAPVLSRELPTDPKKSLISQIVGDNDKRFRCVWPEKEGNSDWILWKVLNKVLSYKWNTEKESKDYIYLEDHPNLVKRVLKNNSEHKFASGWYPTTYINMNIIDRHDMEWHKKEKHYKGISKKSSEFNDSIFFEPGLAVTAYDAIWNSVVEYSGDWLNYDVVLRKLTDKPWYEAFHALDDIKKIRENAKKFIVEGDITEEELSWEGYDWDKLYPITSYSKILSRLGKFIQNVDINLNTKFHEELEELASIEKKEQEKNKPHETSVTKTKEIEDEDESYEAPEDVSEKKEEVPQTRKPAVRSSVKTSSEIDWARLEDGSFNGTKYLGVSEMTEEEKSMVVSINKDGSFEFVSEYKGNPVTILKSESSNFMSPEEFHVDPLSGDIF